MRILKTISTSSLALLVATTLTVQAGQRVTSLSVRGNKRIEGETIRSLLISDSDGTYSDESLNASLKNLYNSGHFKNVNVDIVGKTRPKKTTKKPEKYTTGDHNLHPNNKATRIY